MQKEAREKDSFNSGVRKFIIVGNPNAGKSVLFGRLANKYVTVSNYPGTTVTATKGWMAMSRLWSVFVSISRRRFLGCARRILL
ncbi:MAG: 50S ribosome-binding GTPase [Candidatus Omnitrophica bacterium]|nr:50S ribosome-binding GTPase [Candidatus Omnitrophota bacterium]MCK5180246.1 50S ribosome-binding GTPase [Candidatus Omnitrophota bacterium]